MFLFNFSNFINAFLVQCTVAFTKTQKHPERQDGYIVPKKMTFCCQK